MSTAIITDKADLLKKIDAWGARGKKWTEEGQMLGMSALTVLAKHGDIGPVNRLLVAMPKGTKVTAMVSWFLAYGPLVQNTDKGTEKEMPLVYTKDKQGDLAAASQDPWYNHKPETANDPTFDLAKALEHVISRAKGKELIHGELLTGVQSLLSMVKSLDRVTEEGTEEEEESQES